MDVVSPHKLAVATLLKCYIQDREESKQREPLKSSETKLLARFIANEIGQIDNAVERSLNELLAEISNLPENLAHFLSSYLPHTWLEQTNTIDSLLDHISTLKALLSLPPQWNINDNNNDINTQPTHLSGDGLFAKFVKRLTLSIDKSPFISISRLFEQLINYRANSNKNPLLNTSDGNVNKDIVFYLSKKQLQLNIQHEAEKLEKNYHLYSNEEIEERVRSLLVVVPDLPRAFFLRYLNSMNGGDFDRACDSLLRYFDYCNLSGGPSHHDGGRSKPHYILLNLAGLHNRFGHIEESVSTIYEAIHVAQQAADKICVVYALGWLARVLEVIGDPSSLSILKQAHTRATDLKLTYFTHLTSLSATKYCLLNIKSFNDNESISFRDHHLNLKNGGPLHIHNLLNNVYASSSSSTSEKSNSNTNTSNNNNTLSPSHSLSLYGQTMLLKSASWGLYGNLSLERESLVSFFKFSAQHSSSQDVIIAFCRLALLQIKCSFNNNINNNNNNIYTKAVGTLLHAKSDIKRYIEVRMMHALYLQHIEREEEALSELLHLLSLSRVKKIVILEVLLLLQITRLSISSCPYSPANGLNYILPCLSLCTENEGMDSLLCESELLLSLIHLHLNNAQLAIDRLNGKLSFISEHSSLCVRGETYFTIAKAYLSAVAKEEEEDKERQGLVLDYLSSAFSLFQEIEAISYMIQVVLFKAHVYSRIGNKEEEENELNLFIKLQKIRQNNIASSGSYLQKMSFFENDEELIKYINN